MPAVCLAISAHRMGLKPPCVFAQVSKKIDKSMVCRKSLLKGGFAFFDKDIRDKRGRALLGGKRVTFVIVLREEDAFDPPYEYNKKSSIWKEPFGRLWVLPPWTGRGSAPMENFTEAGWARDFRWSCCPPSHGNRRRKASRPRPWPPEALAQRRDGSGCLE